MESRALGRGLSALIHEKIDLPQEKRGEEVAFLKTSKIKNNAQQPRTHYDTLKLEELKSSIKSKVHKQLIIELNNKKIDINNSEEIVQDAEKYDVIIIPIYAKVKIKTGTVGLPESQLSLINSIVTKGKKVLVISFGNPYLIQGFPEVDAYICAYADAESSIDAVIDSFYGTIKFKGKLPVTISDRFKYGDGITN